MESEQANQQILNHELEMAIYGNFVDRAVNAVKSGANVNYQDRTGASPLHTATHFNNPEMIAALIKLGANVNIRDGLGNTPLYIAAMHGFIASSMTLLQNGAKDVANSTGMKPTDISYQLGYKHLTEIIVNGCEAGYWKKVKTWFTR